MCGPTDDFVRQCVHLDVDCKYRFNVDDCALHVGKICRRDKKRASKQWPSWKVKSPAWLYNCLHEKKKRDE